MKLDLDKEGLEILTDFKPWFTPLARKLLTEDVEMGSREGLDYVNSLLPDGQTRSRAAVIFALDDMVEAGYLGFHEETGKGGHRRIYRRTVDLAGFWDNLIALAQTRLEQERTRSLGE